MRLCRAASLLVKPLIDCRPAEEQALRRYPTSLKMREADQEAVMLVLSSWKQLMGSLSVLMALLAFGIYGWQTVVGRVRPHPLSWVLFGLLSATGYLVQRDEGAGAGSWVMGAMTVICFLLCGISVAKGELSFSGQQWSFLVAGCVVFLLYLFTKAPTV